MWGCASGSLEASALAGNTLAPCGKVRSGLKTVLLSGDVYCWTDDDLKRLLQSGSSGSIDPDKYPALWPIRCLSRIEIVKISACRQLAAAVSRAGQLFTW